MIISAIRPYNINFQSKRNVNTRPNKATIENLLSIGYLDRALELGASDKQIRNILCMLPSDELYASYMTQENFKSQPECLSVLADKLLQEGKINKAQKVAEKLEDDYSGYYVSKNDKFCKGKKELMHKIEVAKSKEDNKTYPKARREFDF